MGGGGEITSYHYTVTARMTLVLIWAAMMRAISVNLHFINCEGQSHNETVSTDHDILKRKRSRSAFQSRSLCLQAERLTGRPNRFTVALPLVVVVVVLLMSSDVG